jgi:transcriptional regulator with XRE-family HTH domain
VAGDNFWGNLIKSLREEQNVSQRVLAEGASINRATLRRIEKGRTPGDIDMIERVLDYLGYDLEALQRTQERRVRFDPEHDQRVRLQLLAHRILSIRLV